MSETAMLTLIEPLALWLSRHRVISAEAHDVDICVRAIKGCVLRFPD